MNAPLIERRRGGQDESLSRFPDWRELLTIIIERAWIGIIVLLLVSAFTYVRVSRETPYYQSTAVMLVEAQIPRLLNYQDVISLNVRSLEYFNTVINTLHSREIMDLALQSTNMQRHAAFVEGLGPVAERAEAVRRMVKITPISKTRLIHVTAEHPDAAVASDLANAVAQAYIQKDLDSRMQASVQGVEWLREQSEEYRLKLEKGLSDLQTYREQTKSVSLEEDQNIVLAKLKALNEALTAAQTERIDAETRWKAIQAQVDAKAAPDVLAAQMQDTGITDAAGKLNQQRAEVARLRQRYKPGFPELQQAIEYEASLQKTFEKSITTAVSALQSRYEMSKSREANLQEALRAQEKESFELDRKLVRYNELKRNAESDQQIYQTMIAKMKEASISGSMPGEVIQLAELARPSKAPYRPRVAQEITKGAMIGLAGGLFLIFFLYYTDHRFRRNEEVERVLDVPVLASLPQIKGETEQQRGIISHQDPASDTAEAFRTLRATIQIQEPMRSAKVFLVTSSQPGDGKSLVSSNLAASFAMDGKKTLLIGADLRRPVLGRIFEQTPRSPGLKEFLEGKVKWGQSVVSNASVPNLHVLFPGSIPDKPAELLGGAQFSLLIKEARLAYDRIIIDSPPILGISDALVLLPIVDGVLFVVRYAATNSLGAAFALKKIRESKVPCFGAVLNGVDLRSLANHYYYRRYGGYAFKVYKDSQRDTHSLTQKPE